MSISAFIELFQDTYLFVLDHLFEPLLTWTLLGIILKAILNFLDDSRAYAHFYTRSFLLYSLPAGILLYNLLDNISINTVSSSQVLETIIYPSIQVTSMESISNSPIENVTFYHLLGFIALVLAAVSVFNLSKLLIHYITIKRSFCTLRQVSIPDLNLYRTNIRLMGRIHRNISIYSSNHHSIPFAFGFLKPAIVIPGHLFNHPDKLNLVIEHELCHIRYWDYLNNLLLLIVKSLFVFHPLVHRLYRENVEFMEVSCDLDVIHSRPESTKKYAELLYEFLPDLTSFPIATLRMACSKTNLKRRIQVMKYNNQPIQSRKFVIILSVICFLSVSLITACSQVNESEPSTQTNPPDPPIPASSEDKSSANADSTYRVVETAPKLKGGLQSLQKELNYPKKAKDQGDQGRVLVQFIVDKNGNVTNPEIIKGVSKELNEEALRVIKNAQFEPGTQDGEPVRVQFSLPIVFRLDNSDKNSDKGPKTSRVEFMEIAPVKDKTPVIRGTILDAATDKPIPKANITLAETQKGAASHSDGKFVILDLDSGKYTLQIKHPDYEFFKTSMPADPGLMAKIYLQKK